MRLFFAVTLIPEIVERVSAVQQELRTVAGDQGIRWTRPEQFHYTLKFLGEQSPPRTRKAVEGALAAREGQPTFDISLGGVGAFPNAQRPSVLWVGATEGADQLTGLAARLDGFLVKQGFPREGRPLKAHLTLARIKTYPGETAAARALKKIAVDDSFNSLGTLTVSGFVLMQSNLRPAGSEYAIVEEFGFHA